MYPVYTAAWIALSGLVGWTGFKVYRAAQTVRGVYTAIRESRKPEESNWVCAWETGKCFTELAWVWVEQKLNRTCVRKGGVYHLTFYIEGKLYKLCIRPKRGPDIEPVTFIGLLPGENESLVAYIRGFNSVMAPTLNILNIKGVFVRNNEEDTSRYISPTRPLVSFDNL
jgi:hypothetical protein